MLLTVFNIAIAVLLLVFLAVYISRHRDHDPEVFDPAARVAQGQHLFLRVFSGVVVDRDPGHDSGEARSLTATQLRNPAWIAWIAGLTLLILVAYWGIWGPLYRSL